MPVYEYECRNCGTRFEKMQSITAEPLTECLNCGKGPVRRVLHPVGVIFKGSGWYITDSRKAAEQPGGARSDGKQSKGDAASGESAASGASSPASESPPADGSD
jgi:putative FmdB family regulatory protein